MVKRYNKLGKEVELEAQRENRTNVYCPLKWSEFSYTGKTNSTIVYTSCNSQSWPQLLNLVATT